MDPLMDSFLKQLYRYTHSRAMRHNENVWPWLKAIRNEREEIVGLFYRKQEIPLLLASSLRKAREGALHIIATGPSINEIDAESLRHSLLMGVNGAFRLNEKLSSPLPFHYYVVIDRGFAKQNRKSLLALLQQGVHLFTTPFCLYEIARHQALGAASRITILEQFNEKLHLPVVAVEKLAEKLQTDTSATVFRRSPLLGFSEDIEQGIFDGRTVAYAALQVAVYLGFTELHFLGLDLNIRESRRFYEFSSQEGPPSSLENDFATHILPAFSGAAQLLKSRNISLVNHALTSALPESVIPKKRYIVH